MIRARSRVPWFGAAFAALALLAAPVIAAKGPGTPDPAFGERGFTSTQIAGTGSGANRVLVEPTGRIVASGVAVAGKGEDADSDFALIAYTAEGELDPSFGERGSLTFDFGQTYVWETPNDLALAADGGILVGGSSLNESNEQAAGVARVTPGGDLDAGLAGDGTLIAGPEGLEEANSVLPLPDGDFYVVGPAGRFVVAARFNSDGSLDPAFAGDGVAKVDLGSGGAVGHALLTQEGAIVVVVHGAELGGDPGLLRFGPGGDPDPSFGVGGFARVPVERLTEIAQGAGGGFVAAGGGAVARLDRDGRLDGSFGGEGIFEFSGASAFTVLGLAVSPKGKAVLSGATKRGQGNRFTVAMLKEDGTLGRAFGKRGFAVLKRGTNALGVTLQDDGKILAVGRTPGRNTFIGDVSGRDTKVAIARLLPG